MNFPWYSNFSISLEVIVTVSTLFGVFTLTKLLALKSAWLLANLTVLESILFT